MIDELAVRLEARLRSTFRLRNSGDERWTRRADEAAAQAAKWRRASPARTLGTARIRKGRGVAIGGFASSFVAVVADIEVDTKTGKIRVKHLYAAHDCGLVDQPEPGRAARWWAA